MNTIKKMVKSATTANNTKRLLWAFSIQLLLKIFGIFVFIIVVRLLPENAWPGDLETIGMLIFIFDIVCAIVSPAGLIFIINRRFITIQNSLIGDIFNIYDNPLGLSLLLYLSFDTLVFYLLLTAFRKFKR